MVSIICCSIRQNFMENVFKNYESQDWERKELIVILNRDDMDIKKWEEKAKQYHDVTICQLPEETTLGACLNYGIQKAKYEFIAKFDDDDYYGPRYLSQSMKAFKEIDTSIVVKITVYMYFEKIKTLAVHRPGEENKFVTGGVKGATLLFRKAICDKVNFPDLNRGEDTHFIKECIRHEFKVYSTNKSNYVCLRRAEPGHHTWDVGDDFLLKKSSIVCITDDYKAYGVDREQKVNKKMAYLTFDDGPNQATKRILEVLAHYKAFGTFFMLEPGIRRYSKIVQRMVHEGHAIGLHGVTHKASIFYASKHSVLEEFIKTQKTLKRITGINTNLVRTPYGSKHHMKPSYFIAVNRAGYRLWDWNADSLDWKYRNERMVQRIIKKVLQLEKKAINPVILMHDLPDTVLHLPQIIHFLEKRGYVLEKLDSSLKPIQL